MSFMPLITSFTVTASDLAISTLILTGVALASPLLYLANFYLRCKRHQAATPWSVQDKVVVITGASSGIGEELAYEFARQGAKLILCARRADKLANVSRVCKEKYGIEDVKIIKADVTRESDVDRLVETVSADYDKVDCLVLNAGVSMGEKLEELEEFNTIKQINDVNYIGSAMLAYYFLPLLKKAEKSRIVVTSSLLGVVPAPLKTGYVASKFALRGFFESLQAELIDQNIFITIAYPGIVATEINENRLGTKARELDYSRGISADECAKIIVDGTIKGHKEINYTKEGKLGRILEGVFPDLLFYISYNQAKKFVGKEKSS